VVKVVPLTSVPYVTATARACIHNGAAGSWLSRQAFFADEHWK